VAIQAHLASITLAGHRPASVNVRGKVLRDFASGISDGRGLHEATRSDIELFLARPLKPASRRAYLAHLRGYFRWALEMELVTVDPTARIPRIKVPRGVPRPVGHADLTKALTCAPPVMRAWVLLMALGGLRCCEVARLRPCDLIEVEGTRLLYLRETKGGGTATVPAHPAVVEALLALRIEDDLWWSCRPAQVSRAVACHLRGVGIDATGHQLRHTAGTAFYRASGHDLLVTAALLRHASVANAQIYAELDPRRAAEVVGLVPAPAA